jgi:ubiquinone/menaquinone biosynthesis C-methylase UbiE
MKKETNVTVNLSIPSMYDETIDSAMSFKRRMIHRPYLNMIGRMFEVKKDFKLLDIGCSTGSFLYFCEKRFAYAHLHGLEYDKRLIELTQDLLTKSVVAQGNAEKLPYPDNYFDVITSFQVIEHLYNPSKMIDEVMRCLKCGGLFILTTPNLNSLGAKVHKSEWSGFRDDHVSLKKCDDWTQLLKDHGFSELKTGTTFMSGLRLFKIFPFSVINNLLLVLFGSINWRFGESYVGYFVQAKSKELVK